MWDIIHGNVNPPQNYEKVEKIANELNLTDKEKNELFNRTALKNDIPIDVKDIILKNPKIIEKIRKMKGDN